MPKNLNNIRFINILLLGGLVFLYACGVYSFSGVSTTAKTIEIANFYNRAGAGPPNIGQDFTESLKEYYQRNSQLSIVDQDAELSIKGYIKRYDVRPIAATANDVAAQNRLTIAVEVEFIDIRDNTKSFNQEFSFYSDFDQTLTLSDIEGDRVPEIFEQITLDIFNRTVADW